MSGSAPTSRAVYGTVAVIVTDSASVARTGQNRDRVYQAYAGGNQLLDSLPGADRSELAESLRVVSFALRDPVTVAGEPLAHVAFPIDCVFSVVALFASGTTTEVGTVGREGYLPGEVSAGLPAALRTSFCQVPGQGALMPRAAFERAFAERPTFTALVQRYAGARLFTSEQLTACNLTHAVVQRCARWLLMTMDRVGGPDFPLTHEFLAMMLGVRRAGVTEAAGKLQRAGAISYRRGNITVLDRPMLLAASCECYEATNVVQTTLLDRRTAHPA
jgi:CRP-like cAMP-binding protein